MRDSDNLKGKRFGRLLILELTNKKNRRYWKCKCDCGNIKVVSSNKLKTGHTESCGCIRKERYDYLKDNPPKYQYKLWRGHEEISMTYYKALQSGARRRDMDFSVSMEYLWNLYTEQNKKCALCGEEIVFARNIKSGDQTASLDRKDSRKGYVEGNVQWVHKDINKIKTDMSQERFLDLCSKVANTTHLHYGTTK